jgi:acyl-CoA hydrolase
LSEVTTSIDECVDRAIATVGPDLVLATPLGLGKPVQLINGIYKRVAEDLSLSLRIITALSLEVPRPHGGVEESLAGPIMDRIFGDYEELAYVKPMKQGTLPANIEVSEFYLKAGSMKGNSTAQQNYISSNYTHVMRDMLAARVNVLAQLVAARDTDEGLSLSLSCNTDLSMEFFEQKENIDWPVVALAQVHDDLPFMELDAQVPASAFDIVLRNPEFNRTLFAVPNVAVPARDYAAALHASSLIVDGGTLQIGIGSLGDAVAHACILRHQQNDAYKALVENLSVQECVLAVDDGPFSQGLYASTEMFVNGMMHLIEKGVIKRKVYDSLALQRGLNAGRITKQINLPLYEYLREVEFMPAHLDEESLRQLQYWGIVAEEVTIEGDQLRADNRLIANALDAPEVKGALLDMVRETELRHGRILHGGFYLGPRDFYDKLRNLDKRGLSEICMTGVNRTNQLLLDYPLYTAQRVHGRFINTGMMVTLTGAVASDALEDGTVISGVGGQYNFVAMANDLPGARSVICIRATRGEGKDLKSNIVPFYGHLTIPKHLRDVVVTEYGVADLRGQSDAEIIRRLVSIADSQFQQELIDFAKTHGKLPQDYALPEHARHNTPERLAAVLEPAIKRGLLPDYPFGTQLTEQEQALASSLRRVKALSEEPAQFATATFRALLHRADAKAAQPFLERMQLEHPDTTKEFLIQQLLLLDLEDRGLLKVN